MTALECKAIYKLVPNAQFDIIDENIIWKDTRNQPSSTAVKKAVEEIKKEYEQKLNNQKLSDFIYDFYPLEKQQQDVVNFSYIINDLIAIGQTEVQPYIYKVVSQLPDNFTENDILEILSKDIPDNLIQKYLKIVKVTLRTQWIQEVLINGPIKPTFI